MQWRTRSLSLAACLALGLPLFGTGQPPEKDRKAPATEGPTRTDRHGDPLPPGARARLGTVRLRHADRVTRVGFSRRGQRLFSAGQDESVRLWDPRTGKEVRRFPGSWPGEGADALSPDGSILVTDDGALHFWDVATGKELPWSPARQAKPEKLCQPRAVFSADGRFLVVAGQPEAGEGEDVHPLIFLTWDAVAGKLLRRAAQPADRHWKAPPPFCVRPGGEVLLAESGERARVYKVGSGTPISPPDKPRADCTFSPDGKFLLARTPEDALAVLDTGTGKERYRLRSVSFSAHPVFSADGKYLAGEVGGGKPAVVVWETASGKPVRRFPRVSPWSGAFAFSPDGKFLAVTGFEQGVCLWNLRTGKKLREIETHLGHGSGLAISPDGQLLAACDGAGPAVLLWDTATGKKAPQLGGHEHRIHALTFSPDGKSLASADTAGVTCIWQAGTGRELRRTWGPRGKRQGTGILNWGGPGQLRILLFPNPPEPAGAEVVAVRGGAPSAEEDWHLARLWDLSAGKRLRTFGKPDTAVFHCALSADGNILAGDQIERICCWSVRTGKELLTIPWKGEEWGRSTTLAFAPDGGTLAVVALDDRDGWRAVDVALWELRTGKERCRFAWDIPPRLLPLLNRQDPNQRLLPQRASALVFSPDGKHLAFGDSGTIRLLEVAGGKEVRRFGGPEVQGETLAFSPDGRLLAARSETGAVHLWEVATGTARAVLDGQPGKIASFAFAPSGRVLATGGEDGTALEWDLARVLARGRPAAPTAAALQTLWQALAGNDAARAHRAVQVLGAGGAEARAFLEARLRPAAPADPQRLSRLLAELGARSFRVRRQAEAELARLGDLAESALERALKTGASLELRRRVEGLLAKLEGPVRSPELLRQLRAVEVLEWLGTAGARRVLGTLAGGAARARLTREARAALRRLGNRTPSP